MSDITKLEKLAKPHGLTVKDCGNGHIQIIGGPMLVNYYPASRRRSAYVAGTTRRYECVTAEQAVKMALEPPPIAHASRKDGRSNSNHNRTAKRRMLQKNPFCHWCKCRLSMSGNVPGTVKATLEHVVPLHRGGLDNPNNRVLACEPCNNSRGHDMPELEKKA